MKRRGRGPGAAGGRGGWETAGAAVGRGPGRGRAPTALPRHAERPFYKRQSEKSRLRSQAERKRPQPRRPARPRPLSPARSLLAVRRPRAASTAPARAQPLPCPAFRPGGCDWSAAPPGRRAASDWPGSGRAPPPRFERERGWLGRSSLWLAWPGRRRAGRSREGLCRSGVPSGCSRGGAAASGPSDLRARGAGRSERGSDWGRAALGPPPPSGRARHASGSAAGGAAGPAEPSRGRSSRDLCFRPRPAMSSRGSGWPRRGRPLGLAGARCSRGLRAPPGAASHTGIPFLSSQLSVRSYCQRPLTVGTCFPS